MRLWFAFIIAIAALSSCRTNPQPEPPEFHQGIFADSLYKYVDYAGRLDLDSFINTGLKEADSLFKKKYINDIEPLKGVIRFGWVYPYYTCYQYAKLKPYAGFQPIVVEVGCDDYGALILLVMDKNENLVSWKEISGGFCGGPDEYDDRLELCIQSNAKIIDAGNLDYFRFRTFLPIIDSLPSDSINEIDSIYYKVKINDAGLITEKLVDSVRFKKLLKNK